MLLAVQSRSSRNLFTWLEGLLCLDCLDKYILVRMPKHSRRIDTQRSLLPIRVNCRLIVLRRNNTWVFISWQKVFSLVCDHILLILELLVLEVGELSLFPILLEQFLIGFYLLLTRSSLVCLLHVFVHIKGLVRTKLLLPVRINRPHVVRCARNFVPCFEGWREWPVK